MCLLIIVLLHEVDVQFLCGFHPDGIAGLGIEPIGRRRHPIAARRQRGDGIESGLIGDGCALCSGVLIEHRDLGIENNGYRLMMVLASQRHQGLPAIVTPPPVTLSRLQATDQSHLGHLCKPTFNTQSSIFDLTVEKLTTNNVLNSDELEYLLGIAFNFSASALAFHTLRGLISTWLQLYISSSST